MLQELKNELTRLSVTDAKSRLASLTHQNHTELIIDIFSGIAGWSETSKSKSRVLLNAITKRHNGLPVLGELADDLTIFKENGDKKHRDTAATLAEIAEDLRDALTATSEELEVEGMDGGWLRGRRSVADFYEAWRLEIIAARTSTV
jgi:hypothetical protein